MHFEEASVDDLLSQALRDLLANGVRARPTKGATLELTGVVLHLTNPRARLSRAESRGTVFSCLGELLWYLSSSNDLNQISYYINRYHEFSDDGRTLHGAYGPRMFDLNGCNQLTRAIELLERNPASRKAVVQLFDASDLDKEYKDVPCTCVLQFLIRNNLLYLVTYMRSNDIMLGFPHDVFAFTMIQELVARSLQIELGTYTHFVGSLHLYEDKRSLASDYLTEGWQSLAPMEAMPLGDPWPHVKDVLAAESKLRLAQPLSIAEAPRPVYWNDLVTLLKIFRAFRDRDYSQVTSLQESLSTRYFDTLIEDKLDRIPTATFPNGLASPNQ